MRTLFRAVLHLYLTATPFEQDHSEPSFLQLVGVPAVGTACVRLHVQLDRFTLCNLPSGEELALVCLLSSHFMMVRLNPMEEGNLSGSPPQVLYSRHKLSAKNVISQVGFFYFFLP